MRSPTMFVDLNTNVVRVGDVSRELRPPQVVELLHVLLAAWPSTCSYESMADRMWGMTDDRSSTQRRQHLAALASMARAELCGMECGVTIEAVSGRGYRLVLPQS